MHHLQHITELAPAMERMGVRHVIIAPGSRNAPITQLFTSNERFTCHSIVDERSAGYVALGMVRQTGKPVVVVTTSGTAVLNLSPAVAEAFHQQLPLVVLTADRPREILPQFNNQVTDQRAPYFNHSKGFFEFPAEVRTEDDLQRGLHAVEELLKEAVRRPGGPVHVNLPLTQPLYEPLPGLLLTGKSNNGRSSEIMPGREASLPETDLSNKKVLILAGMGAGSKEIRMSLEQIMDHGQVAVVAENISNLVSEQFISVPELVLAGADQDELKELVPDVVIAFGQQVVSRRMKLFVNSLEKAEIVVIPDEALVQEWLVAIGRKVGKEVENLYQRSWLTVEEREVVRSSAYLDAASYCNLVAVRNILDKVPEGTVVHLGNSATIRNSQLIRARSGLKYYSNRGTSGIDGSVSTAVGAAMVSDARHLLLVGDLSFVYDSNALWNKDFPDKLKIVILNDGGGGIFRLLDGPGRMEFFEEFSVTHHPVSLEMLSHSFGRSFQRVEGLDGLDEQMEALFSEGTRLSVLEVDTSSGENSRIFKELFS
ncbi:MAG: 2-succinyl-5-enolpyruvyl-6-hydroxy-3-cyclohexene-1-carboxylic-acid synthase [Bacteroidales bacterium]|nr:2-succinyl-5-enolpyruvyl-6-hydroxy-3-cyclohexene-1-carboxylic-acid synthase [Bacteroidales bacterium]